MISHDNIPAEQKNRDAKHYHRIQLILGLVGKLLLAGYAAIWAFYGDTNLLIVSESRWISLLVYAAAFGLVFQLLTLPLDYYGDYVIEHRFGQSNQTPGRWFSQTVKGWLMAAVLGGAILSGLYALLWYAGDFWWAWVWCGWIVFTVVLARLFPVLLLPVFYKSEKLEENELCERLRNLATGTSFQQAEIYRLKLSDDTKSANAMLTGNGQVAARVSVGYTAGCFFAGRDRRRLCARVGASRAASSVEAGRHWRHHGHVVRGDTGILSA